MYSNVIELNSGWGAEYFVNKALNTLGHETWCIDYRKYRDVLYDKFSEAPLCDVFLLQRGDYFPIQILRALDIPNFFWASELVSRCRDQDRLLRSKQFSHVFFRTHNCIESVISKGWLTRDQCSIMLSGFDDTVFRPLNSPKDIDILFVGAITPRRKKLLSDLQNDVEVVVEKVFGEKCVELINRSKIILNIHADDYLDTETRVYEVLGCNAFLLTEKLSPENPFTNQELVEFKDIHECKEIIKYSLANEEYRSKVAMNGYQSAVRKHTYTMRAKELISMFSSYMPQSNFNGRNLDPTLFAFYKLEESINKYIPRNLKRL